MESGLNLSCLQGRTVSLPGGRDKEGHPILFFTIPAESPPIDAVPPLQYLLSLFSKTSRSRGLTVIVDARKGPWKVARSCIRQVNAVFTDEELCQLIVLRPDAFWDKQRVENCTSTPKDKKVIFIPRSRLNKFVDLSELPSELGGNLIYNHDKWAENRQKVEEFYSDCDVVLKELSELHEYVLKSQTLRPTQLQDAINTITDMKESTKMLVFNATETGRELIENIEYENRTQKLATENFSLTTTPQDTLDTIERIGETLDTIKIKQQLIDSAWSATEKMFIDTKDLSDVEGKIAKVTNWILSHAENLLNSKQKVGYDVASAEELRREHEAVELQCWEAYGTYAELIHRTKLLSNDEKTASQLKDLMSRMDFMDFVCKSFALRLERRRNILITSLRFFRLVSEYFDRTGEVFDTVMGSNIADFETAGEKLKELQENQAKLDAVEYELRKEGEKLSDMLSMPVKDSLGKELTVDYSEDIINVRDVLDATMARKNIFSDSIELQKLMLKQVTHIDRYEKDTVQAIQWLDELLQVMLSYHGHVGCVVHEIQKQKEEHQSFQETAKGTYDYGCQLLNASLFLRQSCKLQLDDHANLYQKLRSSWQRLLSVSQEQMTRLRVSAVFHRSVEEQCNQLRDLREAVATVPLLEFHRKKDTINHYVEMREKLIVEVGRMVRLGRLLRSRLKEPLYYGEKLLSSIATINNEELESLSDSIANNEVAIEAISEKLAEVTGLAEELDQELQSAQQDCLIFTPTSTSTPTTSSTTISDPITVLSLKRAMENNPLHSEKPKPDDLRSDDEFLTASECTLQHSRSSSYNTASECEHRFSPWWEYGKDDTPKDISKEKMVLAVGLPELPLAKDVLKPSPEVPPGKIAREVTETTHIKVQQSHCLGVSSFVLTSETVRDQKSEGVTSREEVVRVRSEDGGEVVVPVTVEGTFDEEGFQDRMKECGDWINLKILEITPELTKLGDTLEEAQELQTAHDEVLRQLQNKQSPVEELLRQADQLIATQKPRAEVYAAMAESLGRAWKDINSNLELRKQILDLNVLYHTKAQEFYDKMELLEASCKDTVVPVEIDAVKESLTSIHDQRRALLESLMGALQAGNTLLGKLKELGAEGTLDSRPERIRSSVNKAISQVQGWLDGLHLKRQILESSFGKRKTQLEQCLALAILAADLRELEDTVHNRRELLANSCEYGNSSSSAELLLHEHKKLLPETKQLQERALKITKATEQLVASGCFAGEPATAQSYVILAATSDYMADLQARESLLERVIAFFRSAQTVLTKLDQLEIQLTATALPRTSPQLAQLHSQCSKAIEEATAAPIAEGYAILDIAGRGASGTEGVRHVVEELENKKIALDGLCIAHKEENIRINEALNNFLERHNDIYNWLVTIAEAFLKGHQDMGSDLPMAKDFYDLHKQLLTDLQTKGNEINALLLTLPPILEYLEDNQRKDIDTKVEQVHERWMNLKNLLECRMELSRIYVKFHMEADIVNEEMDKLDDMLLQNKDNIDDKVLKEIEEKFESIVPLYQCAKNTGITFINEAKLVSEPHLDTKRAIQCVESVLERLSRRQLVVTKNWQIFCNEVVEKREVLVKLEQTMTESVKTINWVSKLDSQLYPVITTNTSKPGEIVNYLENKLATIVPDLRKAQSEVNQKMKAAESLILKASPGDEKTINVKNTLQDLNQKLTEKCSDYQVLLQVLIGYFKSLEEIDKKADDFNAKLQNTDYPKDVSSVESLIREHESSRQFIIERLRFAQTECDQISERIIKQEPETAAEDDINKLQHVLELRRGEFENQWRQRNDSLESHRQLCIFDNDLHQLNENIDDIDRQIKNYRGQYGESVPSARATSQMFDDLVRAVDVLELRVTSFNNLGEKLLDERHTQSSYIQNQLKQVQDKWNSLKVQLETSRNLADLAITYHELVEKADEWFREGNKLLVSIARKSTAVKRPEEAQQLLNEISAFLNPGQNIQNDRIKKISTLAEKLYSPDRSKHAPVLRSHNEMIESFSSIAMELESLISNLRAAEEEKLRADRERELARLAEETKRLEEARLEEARRVAEDARRAEEVRLADERRRAEEARIAEETRLIRERMKVEELELEEEKRRAAEARIIEEARQAEERRKTEQLKLEEEARLAEERRRLEEERRMLEEAKLAEAKRIEEGRRLEETRRAEDAKRAEESRRAEEARKLEEARKAEIARLAEEARIAELRRQQEAEMVRLEELRKAEEARILEGKRKAEQAKLEAQIAEEARLKEEARIAELRRQQEVERIRLEEMRKAEEARIFDEKRRAEEARLEAQKAEEARLIEEARIAELRRQQETEKLRLEELKKSEQARILDEKRLADQAKSEAQRAERIRIEEEARIAELRKIQETERVRLEDLRKAEEDRILQEKRIKEKARQDAQREEETRLKEEARIMELRRLQEAERVRLEELKKAEEIRIFEEERKAEQSRLEEQKAQKARLEEESRIAELLRQQEAERLRIDEMKKAQEAKIIDEIPVTKSSTLEEELKIHKKHTVEITEITDVHRIEVQTSASKRVPSPIPIIEDALEKPIFVAPLSDAVIQEGSKFTFMCQVTGHPAPTITWYKAGISIQNNPDYRTTFENGLCSLTIEETFAEDSARYTCRAINAGGQDETTALLSVKETEPEEVLSAPTFVKHLEPATAREGSTFQFECKVEGNPLPTVQWFKNTDCIDNSPDYSITYNNGDAVLKFEHVYLEDKADYTCKACNQMGIVQSTANLIVIPLEPTESPVFISPLSNVMARAGQKIKLECEVSGLPPPIISWSHNGKPVKETRENKLQHEDNKATLIVFEAFPKDAGTYSVSAKNIAGEATSSCSVSVKGRLPTETSDSEIASDMEPIKPSIQLPLSNTSVQEGNRIRLDCVIVGQPEPEVIWYHDDRPVKESTDFQLLFQGDRCSLVIQEALPEDAGEYKVVALNSAGEASSQCILSVIPVSESETDAKPKGEKKEPTGSPPKFYKLLADVLISEGDEVILEGNVSGVPRPEIKWLLNNSPITDTEHFVLSHDDEGNVKLRIANARPDDKGVYTVKAINSLGEVKCFAQLIVKSLKPTETVKYEEVKQAPQFKEVFHDRSAFEDTNTKFECIVNGKPSPKIKWLFNGDTISGKDFLISTSGERQVLAIPNLKKQHSGTITCVAENEVGKASCAASLIVQSATSITLPEFEATILPAMQAPMQVPLLSPLTPLRTEKTQHIESSYMMNREVTTQTSTSQISKIISSSSSAPEPHVEEHKFVAQNEQVIKQFNQNAPEIRESHKIEEFHKVGNEPPVIHEKSSSTYTIGGSQDTQKQITTAELKEIVHKPMSRVRPPKFMTPVIGKIVDQDVDVEFQGILDGQPTPEVIWTKNGAELKPSEKINITWGLNKATLAIKNVKTEDAGRYSCTATNEGGTAVSTADLVVRKTIFPPVFGKRLQAQVIKRGDRVNMEVEVTGTPEPTVTWFKDGIPVEDCLTDSYKLKTMGQCHTLVIEKAELNLIGRFMVRAVNSGGEAQSIADIAVFEPTPDTMVEVVKTVVFEDVRKHETLTSAADKITSSVTRSEPLPVQSVPKMDKPASALTSDQMSHIISSKSEISSSQEKQITQEMKKIRLEYTAPEIPMPKPILPRTQDILVKQTEYEICDQPIPVHKEVTEEIKKDVQEGIETSSISKQSSLQYFVQKIKGNEHEEVTAPKEISIPEQIKPEIYKKFEAASQETEKEIEIPIRIEHKTSPPVPPPKPLKTQEGSTLIPVQHEFTKISSIQHSEAPIQYQTFSSTRHVTEEFDLKPEPPAEICYAPKQEGVKKREEVAQRIKRLSECQKELPQHEIPTGAVKIFPATPKPENFEEKREFSQKIEQSSFQSQSSTSFTSRTFESSTPHETIQTSRIENHEPVSTSSSAYSTIDRQFHSRPHSALSGTEPSQEGILMERQWAHKLSESHVDKSWPPTQQEEPKTQPSWSVHSTLEKKWTPSEMKTEKISKERQIIIDDAPKQHYIAEVSNLGSIIDHQKTSSEVISSSQILKTNQSEKIIEERNVLPSEIIKSWPPAPVESRVVQTIESLPVRPISVQDITNEVFLEPGPPPEIGYAQPPRRQIEKNSAPPCSELIATPIITSHTSEQIIEQRDKHIKFEQFPYKADTEKLKQPKLAPPPSPSKFMKGDFRESEYESDYESRIQPVWRGEESAYRPVHPNLTPTQQHTHQYYGRTPTPPTEFDNPPRSEGPPRPKFEPIEKFKPDVKPASKPFVHKPKAIPASSRDLIIAKPFVLQPGSPPEIGYAAGPKKTQYYKSTVSAPYTNAIQTETSNVVHFDESTERCHRTMSVQQTHKVIKFGDQHKQQVTKLEPFPYQPEPERSRRSTSVPPPPTPSKFQPGEFRESDYESDVEGIRIKPKWSPSGKDSDSLRYRKVRAPASSRSSSAPAPKERVVTPLEFDTQPPVMPSKILMTDIVDGHESMYKRFTENKSNQIMKRSQSYEPALHPGTPPEYGYATDHRIKSTASKIASQHMNSMTHAFKSKTQKFVSDIMGDVSKQSQRQEKNGTDGDAQVYREESRAAQYGTKHVDPDTGLIYFKYDFGYEFGIVLPGEGKQVQDVPVPQKTIIEPPKRTSDIEMPVHHETTSPSNHNVTPKFKPKKFTAGSKSAKWEPTSESEMSEYEGEAKKTNNLLQGSRWDPSSCSPMSLSPSLPSTSPAFNNTFAGSGKRGAETPPSCPSTPGSTHGKGGPTKAPMFITPLRDIAVTCGQAAKFECIVQSEPTPNILWSKNGRIIENSMDYNLHYRNGVCRLTISRAYPEDAGTYTCTATNAAGTTNTTAALQVPGERRSQYIK